MSWGRGRRRGRCRGMGITSAERDQPPRSKDGSFGIRLYRARLREEPGPGRTGEQSTRIVEVVDGNVNFI